MVFVAWVVQLPKAGNRSILCGAECLQRMHAYRFNQYAAGRLLWLALAAMLMRPFVAAGLSEETFPVLEIGTRTYTNVTVRTKAKNYIFIVHSAGMASLKVTDLPQDVQQQLGYAAASASRVTTNPAAIWVKKEIARIDVPKMKGLGKQFEQNFRDQTAAKLSAMHLTGLTVICVGGGIVLLAYLFSSYCLMLICRKTGNPPGFLVWVPVLQCFPMLRAAGMSGWWLLAYLVPGLNFVAHILWSLNIAKARGKSVWVGVLLLLPVTNFFAFLYLAFSDGGEGGDERPEPKIMSLQTV